jgi:hypothetical protein
MVAVGIYMYVAVEKMRDQAASAADFLEVVDGLFYCFNS